MKKIFLLAVFALSFTFVSCTADAIPSATNTNTSLDDIGGQSGQIPVNPPKP